MSKISSVTFCIPTVSHYIDKTVPVLVKNLFEVGIDPENIIVFVNESNSEERMTIKDGVRYYHSNEASYFEWITPKIIIEENLYSEWWFFLHDTVQFESYMPEVVGDKIAKTPNRIIRLTRVHSNNTGLIKGELLIEYKQRFLDFISTLSEIPDVKTRKAEVVLNENGYFSYEPHDYFQEDYPRTMEEVDFYNVNAPRIIERFKSVGLIKYKANYVNAYASRTTI